MWRVMQSPGFCTNPLGTSVNLSLTWEIISKHAKTSLLAESCGNSFWPEEAAQCKQSIEDVARYCEPEYGV